MEKWKEFKPNYKIVFMIIFCLYTVSGSGFQSEAQIFLGLGLGLGLGLLLLAVLSGVDDLLVQRGLPGFLAYAVYLGEVVAPLMLLVGFWVVPAAAVVVVNMVVALVLAHQGDWLALNRTGGWALELQAFYLVSALVVVLTWALSSSRAALAPQGSFAPSSAPRVSA